MSFTHSQVLLSVTVRSFAWCRRTVKFCLRYGRYLVFAQINDLYNTQVLGDTQRQARELIMGPCLGAKSWFLSFNMTQSKAVTGLLTGHNTLRRYLHLIGLSDSPLCRGVEQRKKPRLTLYVNVGLWLHTDMCIWTPSF
jgi:hypothetical protein